MERNPMLASTTDVTFAAPVASRRRTPSRPAAAPRFPFPVVASSGHRSTAERVAARAMAAQQVLFVELGVAPRLSLRVLDRREWMRDAAAVPYGVTHVGSRGELVVGAEPADAWQQVSVFFADRLHRSELAGLVRVLGVDPTNRRGPSLAGLSEALIAHDIAHLLATQQRVAFPTRWLAEAFANYALIAVVADADTDAMRAIGALAEAAATIDGGMPTLAEFEHGFGQMDSVGSVLAELAITRAVYPAYAAQSTRPLARLFDAFRGGRARDADHELGRLLTTRVHPSLADVPSCFAAPRVRLAA
jgi:hypothetical protein